MMMVRYWYSQKQKDVCKTPEFAAFNELFAALGIEPEREHSNFVTLPVAGEMVEVEYTECYSGDDDNYRPNWDDAVFLGETEGFPIRIEWSKQARW